MNFKTPYLERGRRITQSVFAQGSDSHTPGLVPTVLTQNVRTSPKSCSESPTFQIVFIFWVGSVVYFSLSLCCSLCLSFNLFVRAGGQLAQSERDTRFKALWLSSGCFKMMV